MTWFEWLAWNSFLGGVVVTYFIQVAVVLWVIQTMWIKHVTIRRLRQQIRDSRRETESPREIANRLGQTGCESVSPVESVR